MLPGAIGDLPYFLKTGTKHANRGENKVNPRTFCILILAYITGLRKQTPILQLAYEPAFRLYKTPA